MNKTENQNRGGQGLATRSDGVSKGLFPAWDNLFHDIMDVDRFFPSFQMPPMMQQMRQQQPAVNIIENDDEFRIEVSAPGMRKEDFHIDMEEGRLTISAERRYEHQETSGNGESNGKGQQNKSNNNERYTRREFGYSQFSRSFMMPETVDVEKIQASYQDGILCLNLPKREEEKQRRQRRQINIK